MKNYFIILILFFSGLACYAQDEGDDKGGKIRDRMSEYIQDRLGLSKREAEKGRGLKRRELKEIKNCE